MTGAALGAEEILNILRGGGRPPACDDCVVASSNVSTVTVANGAGTGATTVLTAGKG